MSIQNLIYKERPLLISILIIFLLLHGFGFLIMGLEGRGSISYSNFEDYANFLNEYFLIDPTASPNDLVILSVSRLFAAICLVFMSRWGAIAATLTFFASIYLQYTSQLHTPYSILIVASCMLILLLHIRDFE